jgi:large conductance mechanosensitive channel
MKKFFSEFKAFITRGNVLDMAVGVIVGGAFTAIVTALTDHILRPIINWIISLFMGDSDVAAYTFLKTVKAADGTIDLTQSIYIDWGAFISAIINFLLIAFILFLIVRAINKMTAAREKAVSELHSDHKKRITEYCNQGMTYKQAKAKVEEEDEAAAKEKAEKEAAAKAEAERVAQEKAEANTRLLEEIRDLLKKKNQ